MKRNLVYVFSFILNGILIAYIVLNPSNSFIQTRPEFVEGVEKSIYCEKFDQGHRMQNGDVSANLYSTKNYREEGYEWDVCESKRKGMTVTMSRNISGIEPFYQPIEYCPFSPRIEQYYQLRFYRGPNSPQWPGFFSCAILPPKNYQWPPKYTKYPTPRGESAISWSNLGLNASTDVLTFNRMFPKNVIHFDTPYYDIQQEEAVNVAARYIPFGPKIRTMLEIGGGTGSLSISLNKRYDVLVINLVRPEFPYCEFITERGGLCMLLDSFRAMPFAKFSFDVVHHSWVYHSSTPAEWRTVLLEQNRLVRPGGYLWIKDGFSMAVLATIKFILIEQLGYRVLFEDTRRQHLLEPVSFGPIPYEVEWISILVKPNRVKDTQPSCL